MARKKVTIDNFAATVEGILDEYLDEVEDKSRAVTEEVAKKGVNLLRSTSRGAVHKKGSKYPGGWAPDYHTKGMPFYVTIHNKSKPGLPHLLEFSHPVFGNKHYKGRPHIKKVEDVVKQTYEQELKVKL